MGRWRPRRTGSRRERKEKGMDCRKAVREIEAHIRANRREARETDWDAGYADALEGVAEMIEAERRRDREARKAARERFDEKKWGCVELLLERKGMSIVERTWTSEAGTVDIVADDDDGTLVFVEVRSHADGRFPRERKEDRCEFERLCVSWFDEHPGQHDRAVRKDVVSLCLLTEDRVLVKYFVNCLGR